MTYSVLFGHIYTKNIIQYKRKIRKCLTQISGDYLSWLHWGRGKQGFVKDSELFWVLIWVVNILIFVILIY